MPLYDNRFSNEDTCRCARPARVIHCVDCGSLAIEKKKPVKTTIDGLLVFLSVYHCRRCAFKFMDKDRIACNAPQPQMSVKAQRVVDGIADVLIENENSPEFKNLLEQARDELRRLDKRHHHTPRPTAVQSLELNELPQEDKTGLDEVKGE